MKTEKKEKPKDANKEATTKIIPNAQKNAEIISGYSGNIIYAF
ncbi:MAG: hypothetical protein ACJ0DD_01820 [Paracoccaceae bacterium]